MQEYNVTLTRTYAITIKATNEEKAKIFSEFFVGNSIDISTKSEKTENNFSITAIEMIYNEASEAIIIK